MKNFKCECCGAGLPIPKRFDKYIKCSYCDATYRLEPEEQISDGFSPSVGYVLIEPGYLQRYAAKIAVDEEQMRYYPPEVMQKYVKDQLAKQIVDFLIDKIDIKENYDIKNFARAYQTTIRLDTRTY